MTDGVAGDPGLRTSQQAIFPHDLVDQGGFARVRTPNHGNLQGPWRQ